MGEYLVFQEEGGLSGGLENAGSDLRWGGAGRDKDRKLSDSPSLPRQMST